jgi:hypothetical protein
MANTTTTVTLNETREVVIEPNKPMPPRLKQYVTLVSTSINKKSHKMGEPIRLTEADAVPYLAAKQITPLEVAIREGTYPRSKETLTEKVVEAVTGEEIPNTAAEASATPGKKSFLGNTLRDAIQKKKNESNLTSTPPTKIDANKLAAIQTGGKSR